MNPRIFIISLALGCLGLPTLAQRNLRDIPPPDPDEDNDDDTAGFKNPTQRKSPSIKEFFGGSSRN